MLAQNEIELLSSFFPNLKERTAKEAESRSGLSHETTFRLLKNLAKKKYLTNRKVGKTNVYEMIKGDETYQVFVHFMTKRRLAFKEKHLILYKRLNEFLTEVDGIAILFGSYAKGTPTKESDTDMLCVSDKENITAIARTYKTKYNLTIHPTVIKHSEFKNIKTDNPVFWQDLIEYGIVLDGFDYFFKEVYA